MNSLVRIFFSGVLALIFAVVVPSTVAVSYQDPVISQATEKSIGIGSGNQR